MFLHTAFLVVFTKLKDSQYYMILNSIFKFLDTAQELKFLKILKPAANSEILRQRGRRISSS
jgi:hypothetical protein